MQPLPISNAGYPDAPQQQTSWITARRPERNVHDVRKPYHAMLEQEVGPDGVLWDVATLFLVNRECPFRCLMCDLWRNTTVDAVDAADIVAQVEAGLAQTGPGRAVKLYNSGSWFDPKAVPIEAYEPVARLVAGFERVIVESHCAFLGARAEQFLMLLRRYNPNVTLEVAIGLETVHPELLERLNKRVTTADFVAAAEWLRMRGMALRAFVLLRPPFLTEDEGLEWAKRTIDVAIDNGATFTALIPVRGGNGAMDILRAAGDWAPPSLASLEAGLRHGLTISGKLPHQRVTADVWDISLFSDAGDADSAAIVTRINRMNIEQRIADAGTEFVSG
ncbi:MAG: radical SAM protein [Armatimonadaceae bacterium]